jgi:hypothetical protein
MVIYPGEGHGVRRFPAVTDYQTRLVPWFERACLHDLVPHVRAGCPFGHGPHADPQDVITAGRLLARCMWALPPSSIVGSGVSPVLDGAAVVSISAPGAGVAETLGGDAH